MPLVKATIISSLEVDLYVLVVNHKALLGSGGWCKDRKQNSRHWRHGGFPDRRGCCPTHKGNVTTLTYIEDFYNSTLIACAYPDGSAFGTYGADAVPPVKGKATSTPFLALHSFHTPSIIGDHPQAR